MKRSTLLVFFATLLTIWSYGQIDQMMKKMEDAGVGAQGLITLRFTNASNGAPVAYATIAIQGNKTIMTDAEGKIRFDKKPDGTYPIKFEKKGFITEEFQMTVRSEKIIDNLYVVSPVLKKHECRVVLTWGEKPSDLDVHFVTEKSYRISSKDLQTSPDSLVSIEFESSHGYGPESMIIQNIDSIGSAFVVVNDYSNKDNESATALTKSGAIIKVYQDKKLVYKWRPSKKQTGNVWMVFSLQNGEIIPTDEVTKN